MLKSYSHNLKTINMKKQFKSLYYSVATVVLMVLFQGIALAQDSSGSASTSSSAKSSSTTSTTTTDQMWYTQPWVWIVGGAILLLIIVALVRGNNGTSGTTAGRSDSVTVKKTVTRDTDTI